MEIRHLRSFKTIADLKSFTKAAKFLSYGQSTITEHIQILENEIGVPLFNRLGKAIDMTSAGEELYLHAAQLLSIYEKIQSLPGNGQETSGTLNIGASESIIVYRLQDALKQFNASYPLVNINLVSDHCASLRKKLRTGELDLIITLSPKAEYPDLFTSHLKEEVLVFVASAESPVTHVGKSDADALEKTSFIFTEGDCTLRKHLVNYLYNKEITPRSSMTFSSIEAIKQCVRSNLGISMLPYMSIKNQLDEGELKRLTSDDDATIFTAQISHHKDKWISPVLNHFIDLVTSTLTIEENPGSEQK